MLQFHEALPLGFARKSEGMAARSKTEGNFLLAYKSPARRVICSSYALSYYGPISTATNIRHGIDERSCT